MELCGRYVESAFTWNMAWSMGCTPDQILGLEHWREVRVPDGMGVVIPADAIHAVLEGEDLKAGVWFRRGRLLIVSPDSLGTACPLSARNSTYRPVQISAAGSVAAAPPCRIAAKADGMSRAAPQANPE